MDHKAQAVHVMTIANSIIGVSIIAMPYCFKQCGIVLSTIILIVSSIISRLSCHLLLKSAIMARRRTFEFLAFHAFGPLGKFIIEIGLIGFLLGTCIAFFVVMGDLAPSIVAKMTGTKATDTLRTSILMALALFCVLPLGLLRNIDSLTSVCTATIGFYFCLVLKIVVQSVPHIFSGDWIDKVELWRPAGFLQCLPIFSMALFCQTQIFEIYQAIPNASLEKMNDLIRKAVNICTGVYIFVGGFGYIAFCRETFTGNILMSFPSSLMSEVIKIGFVLSVAFSFPLIIFPCRASLYSLLYKRTYALHEGGTDKYIPEGRFKSLTFLIVLVSLVIGVMIPNIELVLGLVGSTIGIMICVVFPAMCFICISTKNTNERILAQLMLFVGVIVMVLGTYANLYAMEEISIRSVVTEKVIVQEPEILKIVQEDPALKMIEIPKTTLKSLNEWKANKNEESEKKQTVKEVRHEPPQPEEPVESPQIKDLPNKQNADNNQPAVLEVKKENEESKLKDLNIEKPEEKAKQVTEESVISKKETESPVLQEPLKVDSELPVKQADSDKKLNDVDNNRINDNFESPKKETAKVENLQPVVETNNMVQIKKDPEEKPNNKKAEEVDKEAIEKEEKELMEQEKKVKEEEKKNLDLIKSLEERNEEQKKLVEEKKKILEEIKQRQLALEQEKQQKEIDQVKQERLKAVEQIQEIAKKAIEKLSGNDEQNNVENVPDQQVKEAPAPVGVNLSPKPSNDQSPKQESNNNNVNANKNEKQKINQPVVQQIGLNKNNLVPLPIAVSNNFSGTLNSIPAAVGIMGDVSKIITRKDDPVEPKVASEKTEEKKNADVVHEQEKNVNILDVLRTRAEKVTVLSENKEELAIQHREIRSVDNIGRKNENELGSRNEKLQDAKKQSEIEIDMLKETVIEKSPKEDNEQKIEATQKSEESCDKDSNAVEAKKQIDLSTERPALKMITRLSDPELVSVKLPDININVDTVLKPLKRDLKSYKLDTEERK